MMDSLFQIGVSNACLACLIALVAMIVGAKSKRPHLAHLLWVLVLIKLVTPPIFNVPVEFSTAPSELAASDLVVSDHREKPITRASDEKIELEQKPVVESAAPINLSAVWSLAKPWIGLIWLAGTLLIVVWSLVRVIRFHCLLQRYSQIADRPVLFRAEQISQALGLKKLPIVATTAARLSPMVWWVGRRVYVVLPQSLIDEIRQDQWQWVLAHELAHVRRRDYLVRWLEWLACACFWWNPIVWLAQRNLRATEELCCDELVLSSLNPGSRTYAESIFAAVESLVRPVIRPPAMASEINSGGFLERRIEMILSGNSGQNSPRLMQFCIVAVAMLFIPLGIVAAQDFDAVKKRLTKAVKHDEITLEQAAIMMEALREAADDDEGEREEWDKEHDSYADAEDWDKEHKRDEREFRGHDRDEYKENEELRKISLRDLEARLMELIEAGKITPPQAKQRFDIYANEILAEDEDDDYEEEKDDEDDEEVRERNFHRALVEIELAVDRGKMSRGQAKERIQDLKQRLWGEDDENFDWDVEDADDEEDEEYEDEEYEDEGDAERAASRKKAEKEFAELVRAGKMNKEQARERLESLRRRMAEEKEKHRRPDASNTSFFIDALRAVENKDRAQELALYFLAAAEIKKMIKAGTITKQQGVERLKGLNNRLSVERDDRDEKDRERRAEDLYRSDRVEFDSLETRIEAGVKAGEITREQADTTYAEIKQPMDSRRDHREDDGRNEEQDEDDR